MAPVPQRVGCDDVLGSDAVEDSCGVCRGNNSDCTTHKGLYTKHHGANREYEEYEGDVNQNLLEGTPGVSVATAGIKGPEKTDSLLPYSACQAFP